MMSQQCFTYMTSCKPLLYCRSYLTVGASALLERAAAATSFVVDRFLLLVPCTSLLQRIGQERTSVLP
jgi:hypothetical protein